MLSTTDFKELLIDQGADGSKLDAIILSLRAASMIPAANVSLLTVFQAANLLIGAAAPDPDTAAKFVMSRALLPGEVTCLRESLIALLQSSSASIQSLKICTSFPFATIEFFSIEAAEYGQPFSDKGIRAEVIISGSLCTRIARALQS